MTWADGPMAAFDLETTSAQPLEARIVTATVLLIDGANITEHAWIANPGVPIPAEATAVHGITDEFVTEHGKPPADVASEIAATLAAEWAMGVPVVAFNAFYDLTVMAAESARHGCPPFTIGGPVVDPYVIDKAVDPYRKGKRRLGDQCLHYGIQLDNAHTSSDDALAAARLAYKLARRYPEIGDLDLATLHERQVEWHAAQAESLERYLRRQKAAAGATPDEIEAVRCERDWPIRRTA